MKISIFMQYSPPLVVTKPPTDDPGDSISTGPKAPVRGGPRPFGALYHPNPNNRKLAWGLKG